MSGMQLYDTIGATYRATRRTDPRIAERIWDALGDARTVLNVGAGTGSYEPSDRQVLAVEPSALMRSQRPPGAAPCLAGSAENLPFDDRTFDAAMAVCTVHHWQRPIAGLREMQRVARRVVVFLFDTSDPDQFWLTRDYLPETKGLEGARSWRRCPSWSTRSGAGRSRCPSRGTAPMASTRPTGVGPRPTWTSPSVAGSRSGTRSGRRSRTEQCEAFGMTWRRAGGGTQPRPPRSRRCRARCTAADRLRRCSTAMGQECMTTHHPVSVPRRGQMRRPGRRCHIVALATAIATPSRTSAASETMTM